MCWNEGKKRHVVEAILIIALIFLIGCTKEEPAQEWEAPQNQSVIINITDTNNIALNANLTIEQIKIIRHEVVALNHNASWYNFDKTFKSQAIDVVTTPEFQHYTISNISPLVVSLEVNATYYLWYTPEGGYTGWYGFSIGDTPNNQGSIDKFLKISPYETLLDSPCHSMICESKDLVEFYHADIQVYRYENNLSGFFNDSLKPGRGQYSLFLSAKSAFQDPLFCMKYSRHIIQVTAKTLGGFVRPNMGKFDKCFAPADTMPLFNSNASFYFEVNAMSGVNSDDYVEVTVFDADRYFDLAKGEWVYDYVDNFGRDLGAPNKVFILEAR